MVLTADLGTQLMNILGQFLEFIVTYGWSNILPAIAILALIWGGFQVMTGKLIPRFYFDLIRADNKAAMDRMGTMEEGFKEVTNFLQQIKAADAEQDAQALKELMAAVRKNGTINNHGEPPSGGGGG